MRPRYFRLRFFAGVGFLLASLFSVAPSARAQGLNIEDWLRRPGVKLVAVEFYATWCKPCMEAVPKWKALHDKYRKDGLRLIVVSTRDAAGGCQSPGWSPDDMVCDDDGFVADRFGVKTLPAAYLWDWQGNLLSSGEPVEAIEAKIDKWMAKAPRVDVQVQSIPPEAGVSPRELRALVRDDVQRNDKLVVVATEEERAALAQVLKRSYDLGADQRYACEVGKAMSPNGLLTAVITRSRRPRLQLKLLSAERGCLVASGTTLWDKDRPAVAVGEAMAALLGRLRLERPQYPWVKSKAERRTQPQVGGLALRSNPPGLRIELDGAPTPYRTPATIDKLPVGAHRVSLVAAGKSVERRAVDIFPGRITQVSVDASRRVGTLKVNATVEGKMLVAEVRLGGTRLGTTPLVEPVPAGQALQVEVVGSKVKKQENANVRPGAVVNLSFDLSPRTKPKPVREVAPPAALPAPPAVASMAGVAASPSPAGVSARLDSGGGGGFNGTPLGWTFVALGLASGGASLVTTLLMDAELNNAEEATSRTDLNSAIDSAQTLETTRWVLLGAGIGLTGLGILFHALDNDGPSPTGGVSPDGAGAWVGISNSW